MPKRRSALRSWRGAVVVVLAGMMAGCVAAPRTSMAEVLDGDATAEPRLTAIARVEHWPQGLSVAGVKVVARQTYTECVEGQNNWKVKDGYRLKCSAHSLVFLGWDGDYATGRDATLAGMASFCTVTGLANIDTHTPSDTSTVLGPNYSCSGGLVGRSQILSGHATEVLVTGDSWLTTFGEERAVAGPQGAALLEQLSTRRWLFAVDVSAVFFQDAP